MIGCGPTMIPHRFPQSLKALPGDLDPHFPANQNGPGCESPAAVKSAAGATDHHEPFRSCIIVVILMGYEKAFCRERTKCIGGIDTMETSHND